MQYKQTQQRQQRYLGGGRRGPRHTSQPHAGETQLRNPMMTPHVETRAGTDLHPETPIGEGTARYS